MLLEDVSTVSLHSMVVKKKNGNASGKKNGNASSNASLFLSGTKEMLLKKKIKWKTFGTTGRAAIHQHISSVFKLNLSTYHV